MRVIILFTLFLKTIVAAKSYHYFYDCWKDVTDCKQISWNTNGHSISPDSCSLKFYSKNSTECEKKIDPQKNSVSLGDVRIFAYEDGFPKLGVAFNVYFTNIKWKNVKTQFNSFTKGVNKMFRQDLSVNGDLPSGTTVFYGGCLWSEGDFEEYFEQRVFKFEYVASNDDAVDGRTFLFTVPTPNAPFPKPTLSGMPFDLQKKFSAHYIDFSYIDITDTNNIELRIQNSKKLNITTYYIEVWRTEEENHEKIDTIKTEHPVDDHETRISFTDLKGGYYYYFRISHEKSDCNKYNCLTPTFWIDSNITMISVFVLSCVTIIFIVIFLALLWKAYTYKREMLKNYHPKVFVCHSPGDDKHSEVVSKLLEILKKMFDVKSIDLLEIQSSKETSIYNWCLKTFQESDIVMFIPVPECLDRSVIRNTQPLTINFIKQELSAKSKKLICTVTFPYSRKNDIPEEINIFKVFLVPQQITALMHFMFQEKNKFWSLFLTREVYLTDHDLNELIRRIYLVRHEISRTRENYKNNRINQEIIGNSSVGDEIREIESADKCTLLMNKYAGQNETDKKHSQERSGLVLADVLAANDSGAKISENDDENEEFIDIDPDYNLQLMEL